MPTRTQIDDLRDAMTLAEVAEQLRVHRRTVSRLIERGELDAVHPTPGRVYVIQRSFLDYTARKMANAQRKGRKGRRAQ